MEEKELIVGTKTKTKSEIDQRDFKVEVVLPIPSQEELDNLPKTFSLGMYVGKTYYQNGWGSCTALGTVHSMLIQNIKEIQVKNPELLTDIVNSIKLGNNFIELFWENLWENMGHKLDDKSDSGDYVEKALNTAIKMGIKGRDEHGLPTIYFGQNFSYKTSGKLETDKQLMKYYLTKYPIVDVIAGNNNTWLEMNRGEVKTVVSKSKSTGAHCICRVGYDEGGMRYLNSWTPNDSNKKKSVFYIKWETYFEMVKVGMANWRYWILFDKANAVVDLDLFNEENNAIEVLKLINKFYGKTRFDNVKMACSGLGKVLRANYPRANKEIPL